jgi:hypothetical protein
MIRRVLLAGLVAALVVVVAAQVAGAASTLYGSSNTPGGGGPPQTATLSTVDVGTGSATPVGTLPFSGVNHIGVTEIVCQPNATSAATAICYAQAADSTFSISQFNLSTGAAIGAPVGDVTAFNGLAYVGSTLYGASITTSHGPSTLKTLNPVTGVSVAIGLTGVGPITGLAWNGTTMYGIAGGSPSTGANLYTINLSTGAATVVGNTGIKGAGSLQFGPDGNLYAGGDSTDGGHLYRVNKTTGAATLVGASGFPDLTGLALVTFPNPLPPPAALPVVVTPRFTG